MEITPEKAYDDITDLAALICETSIALVSLINDGQQSIKSRHGIDADQALHAVHLCERTIAQSNDLFVVPDTRCDERFADTPLSNNGTQLRFCAGAALATLDGDALGMLCVIDEIPHQLTADQENALQALSRQVVAQVELRNAVEELKTNTAQLRNYQSQLEEYHQQLELTNARLRTLSVTDDLTGLNNRFSFEEEFRVAFESARQTDSSLSLLLLDADHFKSYNDEFGHPAGDDALRMIAGYLKESMRSTDFIARIGGEEFVILLPETDGKCAAVLAERCRKMLESCSCPKRPITVSIGISTLDERHIDTGMLICEADRALYHSKATGRNRVSHASELPLT